MDKPVARNAGGPRLFPIEEQKRCQRVMVRMPVTLLTTIAGHKVTVAGVTASVNNHGALLQCSQAFGIGTKVEVQNDRTGQKQICKVIRTPVENQQSYLIPVEFASPAPGFWHISFPPRDWEPLED